MNFNFFPNQMNNRIPINKNIFMSFLPQLTPQMLEQLRQQALMSGMKEEDINTGIQFINQLKNR